MSLGAQVGPAEEAPRTRSHPPLTNLRSGVRSADEGTEPVTLTRQGRDQVAFRTRNAASLTLSAPWRTCASQPD